MFYDTLYVMAEYRSTSWGVSTAFQELEPATRQTVAHQTNPILFTYCLFTQRCVEVKMSEEVAAKPLITAAASYRDPTTASAGCL